MNIEDLTGKTLFLEDLKELSGPGTISSPNPVILSTVDALEGGGTVVTEVASENYYADFDGQITIDYRDVVSRLIVPVIPDLKTSPVLAPSVSGGYRRFKLMYVATPKLFTVNGFSSDAKNRLTDIDYLHIPCDGLLVLNVFAGWESCRIHLQVGNVSRLLMLQESLVADGNGYYSYIFKVPDLDVGTKPFRFIVDTGESTMASCIYRCTQDDFQQFLFSSRLGGYVSIPFSGDLEMSGEHVFENARYSSGWRKAASRSHPVYTQYTGGLTRCAASVLSELLLCDYAFHLLDGSWKRIVIEETELSTAMINSLQYGSFKFRYAEDLVL